MARGLLGADGVYFDSGAEYVEVVPAAAAIDLAEQVCAILAVESGIGDRHPEFDRAANRVGNGATLQRGSCRCE